MDEEKKRIEELENELKEAKEAAAKVEELEAKVTELTETVAEKDKLIEQKNADIVGARRQYKKLADMTEEEKQQLSEKELELQQRMEEHEERVSKFEKEQAEQATKEREARRDAAISKIVGENKELGDRVRNNYDRIKDSGDASTVEEIAKVADEAFNMLGEERPNPIDAVVGGQGGGEAPGGSGNSGFADSDRGKGLSEALGLPQQNPDGKQQ